MVELSDYQKRQVLHRCEYSIDYITAGRWGFRYTFETFDTEAGAWDGAWAHLVSRNDVYLHKKGGVYRKLHEANQGTVIVYEHIWPHERGVWVRDRAEFEDPGRFVKLS
jgi:hypothetical protein